MVLVAIFITAMGVASLQVAANPYVAMLGDAENAPARLSLSSSINSLGTTAAPYIGAAILFGATQGSAAEQVKLVQLPYLACAAGILVIMTLIAIGLCNSIMYPVIFSLALDGLGNLASKASALLVMAGIGGAVWPIMQALVADSTGLLTSFWVPVLGYLAMVSYGMYGYQPVITGNPFESTRLPAGQT